MIYAAIALVLLVCIPYVYYAIKINNYISEHAPDGYRYARFSDTYRIFIGALATQFVRFLVHQIMPAIYGPIAKGSDPATKIKYTYKACEHTYRAIYFLLSAIWGWYILRDCPFVPWSLGGPKDGDILKMGFERTIYFVNDPRLFEYSLYTFGFHFGNFI